MQTFFFQTLNFSVLINIGWRKLNLRKKAKAKRDLNLFENQDKLRDLKSFRSLFWTLVFQKQSKCRRLKVREALWQLNLNTLHSPLSIFFMSLFFLFAPKREQNETERRMRETEDKMCDIWKRNRISEARESHQIDFDRSLCKREKESEGTNHWNFKTKC